MFPEFKGFSKIYRYSRECIITEKIDGTNGLIYITEEGTVYAGSRTRWLWSTKDGRITDDNYGFAGWVQNNIGELMKLGPGLHYGEWWGQGIQRNYGLKEKRFSLFNVSKWDDDAIRPKCCRIVPTLYKGSFNTKAIDDCLAQLKTYGSVAEMGFLKPEGIVIFHVPSRHLYKKTIEKDEQPKGINE